MRTEEDIKQKVIMPFLTSLGFGEDELEFEKSFSLHLGRYAVRIDTEKQVKEAHPRLDVLVKRDGKNLFVIEAKTDIKDLTDDDKEQAISYARLVHPMAQLAVVTNGRDFKIYNPLDKTEISEREKTKLLRYRIGEDIQHIYEEAFEYFIGYSLENVRIFCDAQIKDGMKTLLGSKERPNRKFIPELYVPSKKLIKALLDFLGSDKPAFAIIGESGSGKTCSMCGLALDLIGKNPVLFYRAVNLTEGLIKSISNDFNWEFSTHYNEITLLKRLDKIFKGEAIVIFVDGVDEWVNPNKVEILGDFASKIKNRNFKLVISCKSGQWDRFVTYRGIPTSLSEEVFTLNENKGYLIEPFDDQEFYTMVAKYRQFYHFKGVFESDVLEECKRSPFLLRVFFEVAQKTKLPQLTFSIKEFYDEYYKAVIENIPDDKEVAENTIKGLARIMFERNVASIDTETIRRDLKLKINETLMPSLFECNILENSKQGSESQIGFYFEKLRDYVIAFKVKKWDGVPIKDFHEDWAKIDLKNVQLAAMSFFYEFADIEKKKIIDAPLRANAEVYLNLYAKILDEHFYNLKNRFQPGTPGAIGFIGALEIKNGVIVAYGFRHTEKSGEDIKLIPIQGFWNKRTNLMYLHGAGGLHYKGSCNGFNNFDIKKEVLEAEVIDQLKQIVDNGLLNESNNYYLALEKVLGIIVRRQSNLHGIKRSDKLSQYLPIPIDKVEYGMRYEKALSYFENKLIEERKEKEIIKSIWSGSTVSYSYSFSSEDREFIHQQAHETALNKKELKSNVRYIDLEEVEDVLNEALSTIKQRKNIIDETILPDQDAILIGKTGLLCDFYKRETLISYLHRIYTLFLQEYKILIETSFPTLKNFFSLYSEMPLHYFVVVGPQEGDFSIKIFKCKNSGSNKDEVTLCQNEDVSFDINKFSFAYKQKNYKLLSILNQGITSILSPWEKFMNIDVPREFTILRSMVYRKIKGELPKVLEKLTELQK
jgi:Holliday junction resolvase